MSIYILGCGHSDETTRRKLKLEPLNWCRYCKSVVKPEWKEPVKVKDRAKSERMKALHKAGKLKRGCK